MSLDTYANLKAEIASWLHRSDLTGNIPTFIAQCESDLQVKCKIVQFEATGNVSVASGTGTLPTDFVGMRSVYWDYNPDRPLTYVTPQRFNAKSWLSAIPDNYTIVGGSIKVAPTQTGTLVLDYNAKFTALSDVNTTNSLLTNHPNVYLYGSLVHAGFFTRDKELSAESKVMFEEQVQLIKKNSTERKYGAALQVKVA